MDEEQCFVNVQFGQLLLVSRTVGVAPVRLTRIDRGYIVTVSQKYVIYNTFINLITCVFCMCITFLYIYIANNNTESTILTFLYTITMLWDLFSTNFALISLTYSGRKRFNRLIMYLRRINEINMALDSEYIDIKLKKSAVVIWLTSIIACIAFYIAVIIFKTPIPSAFALKGTFVRMVYAIHYFIAFWMFLLEMQYVYVLCLIKATIDLLNRRLKLLFSQGALSLRSKALSTNTKHLFRVYVSICDLLEDFNSDDGLLIFSLITFHMSNVIGYYLIQYYGITSNIQTYIKENLYTNVWLWLKLLYFIYKFARFTIFVESCHRVNVEEVRKLVSELSATSSIAHAQLQCFHLNMLLHAPVVAPLGLAHVTRSFIPKVLGGVTTVLTFMALVHDKSYGI